MKLMYLSLLLTVFYLINGLFYLFAIYKLLKIKKDRNEYLLDIYPFVSVIVPSRNEADNISKCINSLLSQNYPKDKYEIIPVNDGSDDETKNLLENYTLKFPQINLINIESKLSCGKLNAIDKGILKSKGEIIITTDADVWMRKNWIKSMVKDFDLKTGMIVGLAIEKLNNKLITAFQTLDACVIRIVSVSLIEMKMPITCQGANLAFKKDVYFEVRERVLSLAKKYGNREWLMQEIDLATKWNIKTQCTKDSIVSTNSPINWLDLINQRARWASTGKQYSKKIIRIYLLLIYLSMLNFILLPFLFNLQLVSIFWLIKFIIDILVAFSIIKILEMPRLAVGFPLVFILQPVIVVVSGLLGSFNLYRWK